MRKSIGKNDEMCSKNAKISSKIPYNIQLCNSSYKLLNSFKKFCCYVIGTARKK